MALNVLNGLEGHSPVAGLFKCKLLNICAVFYQISTDSDSWASCRYGGRNADGSRILEVGHGLDLVI